MERSSSTEANNYSASLEICRILWNLKIYYRIHNSPLPVSILTQINPIHVPYHRTYKIS